MTQPTVSKHWRRVVSHPDRPQSNHAHLTVLQYYNMHAVTTQENNRMMLNVMCYFFETNVWCFAQYSQKNKINWQLKNTFIYMYLPKLYVLLHQFSQTTKIHLSTVLSEWNDAHCATQCWQPPKMTILWLLASQGCLLYTVYGQRVRINNTKKQHEMEQNDYTLCCIKYLYFDYNYYFPTVGRVTVFSRKFAVKWYNFYSHIL